MFYIEQEQGALKEAAMKLVDAVKSGDMATAKRIYEQNVGPAPEVSDTWWVFNAPHAIVEASGLTTADYAGFTGKTGENRARQAAWLAQQRIGGKWRVVYEY